MMSMTTIVILKDLNHIIILIGITKIIDNLILDIGCNFLFYIKPKCFIEIHNKHLIKIINEYLEYKPLYQKQLLQNTTDIYNFLNLYPISRSYEYLYPHYNHNNKHYIVRSYYRHINNEWIMKDCSHPDDYLKYPKFCY